MAVAGANQDYFIALILFLSLALHDKKTICACVYSVFARASYERCLQEVREHKSPSYISCRDMVKKNPGREGKRSRGLRINDASVSRAQ